MGGLIYVEAVSVILHHNEQLASHLLNGDLKRAGPAHIFDGIIDDIPEERLDRSALTNNSGPGVTLRIWEGAAVDHSRLLQGIQNSHKARHIDQRI